MLWEWRINKLVLAHIYIRKKYQKKDIRISPTEIKVTIIYGRNPVHINYLANLQQYFDAEKSYKREVDPGTKILDYNRKEIRLRIYGTDEHANEV